MDKAPAEILLVEDDPPEVELILALLREARMGNRVAVARDGEEALRRLFGIDERGNTLLTPLPRLILLDLKLPKVDGFQVLREIKRQARTQDIPVVVFTSSNQEKDIVESAHLGVYRYVQKPVDFSEFRDVIKQLRVYWQQITREPTRKAA